MTAPYFLSVLSGGLFALLSVGPYRKLVKKGLNRHVAAVIVSTAVTLMGVGPLVGITVVAVNQAVSMGRDLSEGQDLSLNTIIQRLSKWQPARQVVPDKQQLQEGIRSGIQNLGKAASAEALNMISKFPEFGLQAVLFLLSFYFLLVDGEKLIVFVRTKIPIEAKLRNRLYTVFKDTAILSLWASLAVALAQSFVMFIAFASLGVPMVVLATGATFILSWIPLLGSTPVSIVGAIYLFSIKSVGKMVIMLLMGLLTGLIDNLIRSLVLRGRGSMHPLISLVAIFGAIRLFGIVGVFFGPILAALLLSLLNMLPLFVRGASGTDDEKL